MCGRMSSVNMNKKFSSHSARETKIFAESLAQKLIHTGKDKRAVVLGLVGNLGSGKTTFTQGLIKGFGVQKRVLSPTFVILKRFCPSKRSGVQNVYHIDAYRIHRKDLLDLGWEKIVSGHNVVIIEWADRIRSALPQHTVWIYFKHGKTGDERYIIIN